MPSGTDTDDIVSWEVSGDRNGVARDAFNVAPLPVAPSVMPAGQTVQVPAGVDYQPPVGRSALRRTYIESADGSPVNAVLVVYRAEVDVVPR